jgi:Flp pilus assembly protein TadB
MGDESMQDAPRTRGLVVVGAAALAFVVCVATFALGKAGAGVAAAIVAMLAFGAGLSWLAMDRRRIRQAERDYVISHPA